jgi:UDP-2-acetamido-2-deoxy-ribo-hexuluronate aminotransferase
MTMEFIDLKFQYQQIKTNVNSRIQAVLDHGQYILGPEVWLLEDALAKRTGSEHCIACASGTDALLIALLACGIGPGDEVVTAPFTFVATAEMIALIGATPVFVDIDPDTYNLDPSLLERSITPRSRAIMPVSMYGQCADFHAINEIAARHGLPVIEDGAQSFGATYRGRQSCNLSTIGCTSFFPSKPLGCYGDGGACFTNDDALAAAMRQIRAHGQSARYRHACIGLNGRLDTLQAAILLAKLEVFDEELESRACVAARYNQKLSDIARTPRIARECSSVYAQYTIEVEFREHVAQAMKANGIPTAIHYPCPLHLQPAFAYLSKGPGSFPNSERASRRVLSLPMHPYLKESDQDRIRGVLAAETTRDSVVSFGQ